MAEVSYLITGGLGNFTTGGGGGGLTATEVAAAVWNAADSAYLTAGSKGAVVSSRASQASVDASTDALEEVAVAVASLEGDLADVKASTDGLTFTVPGSVDANVTRWRGTAVPVEDTPGYPKVTIKVGTGVGEVVLSAGSVSAIATNLDKTGYSLSVEGIDAIFDEIVESAVTFRESMRLANAANAGKVSGANTTVVGIRDLGDTKNRITATVDPLGNRTALTLDLT